MGITNNAEPLTDWKPVAEELRLKERAFWKLVHEHGLPHYRINDRVYRFRLTEIRQWLAQHRRGV